MAPSPSPCRPGLTGLAIALVVLASVPLAWFLTMAFGHANPTWVRVLLVAAVLAAGGAIAILVLQLRGPAGPAPSRADHRVASFGAVEVDLDARVVRRDGEPVELTPMEFDLLAAFVHRRGKAVSRLELLREVWGHEGAVVTRTVDVHVAALRKKIEPEPSEPRHLRTVSKVGYRLDG